MEGNIILIDKPYRWTSFDVVKKLRYHLKVKKIGHAGTLDPAATGVLPILLGKGTKIAQYLQNWDKEYAAVMRLGQRTDTQDGTGTIIQESWNEAVTEASIKLAIAQFQGDIQQTPPMYSAIKVKGIPLYRVARKGQTIDRTPRSVTIHCLKVGSLRGKDVDLRIVCSKGTYVRTLCADIGDTLKVGAACSRSYESVHSCRPLRASVRATAMRTWLSSFRRLPSST